MHREYLFVRTIRQSARIGVLKRLEQFFHQAGGVFTYEAPVGPIDAANYDDPHKPRPRRPVVDDDLEGWEPLR